MNSKHKPKSKTNEENIVNESGATIEDECCPPPTPSNETFIMI